MWDAWPAFGRALGAIIHPCGGGKPTMPEDFRAEQKYERVTLAGWLGHPWLRRLCIMSFVAYLAGDRHTDRPQNVSPVIRNFAIRLNDGVIDKWRQELKPFAPRMIGTDDGNDGIRAEMLCASLGSEVFLRRLRVLEAVLGTNDSLNRATPSAMLFGYPASPGEVLSHHINLVKKAYSQKRYPSTGRAVGGLFVFIMDNSEDLVTKREFWFMALDLIDRLCNVSSKKNEIRFAPPGLQPMDQIGSLT